MPSAGSAKPAKRVPGPAVARLATYLKYLRALEREGVATVSSSTLAARAGVSAAQFRKDLSHLAGVGRPGVGYGVDDLRRTLEEVLGLGRPHQVLLVGAGSLGAALCTYPGFAERGFLIAAVFDSNRLKVGQRLAGQEVRHIEDLIRLNRSIRARFGVIAVPPEAAQDVAERLVAAGVRCILNFAPVRVSVDRTDVVVRHVDLTQEFEVLSYYLTASGAEG
jgi:redox-sensing transcriptional repressor